MVLLLIGKVILKLHTIKRLCNFNIMGDKHEFPYCNFILKCKLINRFKKTNSRALQLSGKFQVNFCFISNIKMLRIKFLILNIILNPNLVFYTFIWLGLHEFDDIVIFVILVSPDIWWKVNKINELLQSNQCCIPYIDTGRPFEKLTQGFWVIIAVHEGYISDHIDLQQ